MAKTLKLFLFFFLTFSLTITKLNDVFAQSNSIPQELLGIVTKFDSASNNRDVKLIKEYISSDFTNEDGLTYETFSDSLEQLWSKYDSLQYSTKVESWRKENNQIVAITVTTINGSYEINGQKFVLNSQIKSEQFFVNNKLVKQNILAEKNEITSGENPPIVKFNIPEKARSGEKFNFDVILEEPIGSDFVLGAVLEEKIDSSLYTKPSSLELEALTAGGIFKQVKLPLTQQDHWYSVILIRDGGIRVITQRVNIEG